MMIASLLSKDNTEFRYVRWWQDINIATVDNGCYFGELQVWGKAGRTLVNFALGNTITASFSPTVGSLSNINDGVLNTYGGTNQGPFPHYVQLDLGDLLLRGNPEQYIMITGYWQGNYKHQRVWVELSQDADHWITIFDTNYSGTYTETETGKIIHL